MVEKKNIAQSRLELVSPAGGWDQLKAAVNAGADAVYLGYKKFGARAYAENFELSQLKKAIKFAHSSNVKVYLTLNTLLKNSEISEVINFLNEYTQFCRDGIIIQDLGLYKVLNDLFPMIRVHASTQFNTHNSYSVQLLKELKFSRVILAREMMLEEIKDIADKKIIEIEIFAHGSQCYSYSGNCYFSSFTGERSGNRGRCPQPCRMKYSLIACENNGLSGSSNIIMEAYLLSKSDLCTLEILPQIADLRVDALKIEGRMKSADYVGIVTKIYRKYIDLYYKNPEGYKVDALDKYKITQIFSREMGTGYFKEKYPKEIISQKKSGSVGNFLGRIFKLDFEKNKIKYISFKSSWPVNKGDILEIWTKKGNEQIKISDIELIKEEADKKIYKLALNRRLILSKDDRIFKFYDISLDVEAKKLLEIDTGNQKTKQESMPAEVLGINEIQSYSGKYKLNIKNDKTVKTAALKKNDGSTRLKLAVISDGNDISEEFLGAGADMIIYDDDFTSVADRKKLLPSENLIRIAKSCALRNVEFILNTPAILYDSMANEFKVLLPELMKNSIKNFALSNLSIIKIISGIEEASGLYLNHGLNIFNNLAVLFYFELINKINSSCKDLKMEIKDISLSPELNNEEMSGIISTVRKDFYKDLNFSIFSYGYYPIMTARYRPEFLDAKYRENRNYQIKDNRNYRFRIGKDYDGNMIVYNSRKTCTIFDLEKLMDAGLNHITVDTKFIGNSEKIKIVRTYKKAIVFLNSKNIQGYKDFMNTIAGDELFTGYTRGHLNRGVI